MSTVVFPRIIALITPMKDIHFVDNYLDVIFLPKNLSNIYLTILVMYKFKFNKQILQKQDLIFFFFLIPQRPIIYWSQK
jgi:hypothetical protein